MAALPGSWFLWRGIRSEEGRNRRRGREGWSTAGPPGRPRVALATLPDPSREARAPGHLGQRRHPGPLVVEESCRGDGGQILCMPVHRPVCKRRGCHWQPGSGGHPPACCLRPWDPAGRTFSGQRGASHPPQAKAGQAFGSRTRQQAPRCGKKPCDTRAVRGQMRAVWPHDRSGLLSASGAEVAAILTTAQTEDIAQAAQSSEGTRALRPGGRAGLGEQGGRERG